MKRMLVIFTLLLTLLISLSVQAADTPIILNDATPSVDAVISLPEGTTGAIAVELAGASLTVYDSAGEIALQVADERVHHIQFNIMPNMGDHTLHVERLEGVDTAAVTIESLAEFLLQSTIQTVNDSTIGLDQSTTVVMNSTRPNSVIDVNIPADKLGVFAVNSPNIATMSQLTDASGAIVATSMRGHIDGLSMLIDGGDYQYTMLATNLAEETVADVRVSSYDANLTPLLYVPQSDAPVENTVANTVDTNTAQGAGCNAEVFVSSVNLRSGPGTGYSVINYGFQNDVLPVGGVNPQNTWIVVGLPDGSSAWMTKGAVNLSGDCTTLTNFDIPYREAQPAEVVVVNSDPVVQQSSAVVVSQEAYSEGYEYDEDNEEYEDDDEYEEYEDDDEYEEYEDDDEYEEYEDDDEYEEYEDDDEYEEYEDDDEDEDDD